MHSETYAVNDRANGTEGRYFADSAVSAILTEQSDAILLKISPNPGFMSQ